MWLCIFNLTGSIAKPGINPKLPIREQIQIPYPIEKLLTRSSLTSLDLQEERKEVYWAVCELVKSRLEKARSV